MPLGALWQTTIYNDDDNSRDPDGSGCTPGVSDLPDGVWYGYIFDQVGSFGFDLVCRYSNGAAKIALHANEGRPADDTDELYRRNQSTRERVLEADSDSTVIDLDDPVGDPDIWRRITTEELLTRLHDGRSSDLDGVSVWVWMKGGHVERLEASGDNYAG